MPASQVDGQELSTVQEQSDTQSGDKAGGGLLWDPSSGCVCISVPGINGCTKQDI